MSVNVMYQDRKGEMGKVTITNTPTWHQVNFQTFFQAKSYAGLTKQSIVADTVFTAPAAPGVDNIVNNDKDFKAVLGFEGAEGRFKFEMPCPKINVEGGFTIRWGQNRAFIPPVKADGETGDDGAAIQTAVRNFTGDQTVKFKYGRLKKVT